MLITIRDDKNQLLVKDILAIEFDMSVAYDLKGYYVKLNSKYRLEGHYSSKDDAEERMLQIACERNREEKELMSV